MKKNAGIVLLVTSVISLIWIGYVFLNVDFWLKPPHEKFAVTWADDMKLLEVSKKLPKQWNEIREVNIRTDNSPIQDWVPLIKAPVRLNPQGRYRLEVFLIHWIENNRYGVVTQYNLIDLTNTNTIWEMGRTFKLGFIY